jgi:hypothetical protein
MSIQHLIAGLLKGLGQGALQNYNVQTLGPNFKERQDLAQSQMANEMMGREAVQEKLNESEIARGGEEQEALAAFPGMEPEMAMKLLRAKKSGEAEKRVQESHQADITLKGAEAKDWAARPGYHQYDALLDDARLKNILDQIQSRGIRDKVQQDAEGRKENPKAKPAGPPKPPKGLTFSEKQKLREEAIDSLLEELPKGQKPTPEQIRKRAAELRTEIEGGDAAAAPPPEAVAGPPAPAGPPVKAPSVSPAVPGAKPPKLYKLPNGQLVQWSQLPPQIQQALKAKGLGE